MRVWVDITDASQVVFFAPIVRRLEDAGHTVTLTARRFAGADLVLRRCGLGGMLTTTHRGGDLAARAVGLVNRTAQLLGSASSGHFDVAAGGHASDFALTAWTLGIPQMTFLDDERLRRINAVNLRLVDEVAVPEAVPLATLVARGAAPEKLLRYPGFKEEYYLYDVRPDVEALSRLGVDRRRIVGVLRPPAPAPKSEGRPPPGEAELAGLARDLAGRRKLILVLVARDREQRERYAGLGIDGLIAPESPIDGVGLIAAADFVLSGGGAMAREAAALGTPAYVTTRRPLGAVDAALLRDGRLRLAAGGDDVEVKKKAAGAARSAPRDPWLFADKLLDLARRRPRRARLGRLGRDAGDAGSPPLV